MACIVLVAHEPLATALLAVACHAFSECSAHLTAVDIPPSAGIDEATEQILATLKLLPGTQTLVLVDVFGATPCNAACAAVEGRDAQIVAGLNVPMLWRTLCYSHLPFADLVERAFNGGRQGVTQVAVPPSKSE